MAMLARVLGLCLAVCVAWLPVHVPSCFQQVPQRLTHPATALHTGACHLRSCVQNLQVLHLQGGLCTCTAVCSLCFGSNRGSNICLPISCSVLCGGGQCSNVVPLWVLLSQSASRGSLGFPEVGLSLRCKARPLSGCHYRQTDIVPLADCRTEVTVY